MSLNQPVGIPFQNPGRYLGEMQNILPVKRFPRRPLTTDKKYRVGQFAILGRDPSTGVEGEIWYLARFESNGDATWLNLSTGAGGTGIDFLQTDDGAPPVPPDSGGIVDVLGGTGIVTSGQAPGTTVTIAIDGSVVTTQYDADTGSATPSAGVLEVFGGTGIVTSASGNTITIEIDGSEVATQYDTDSGTAVPSGGILNILGGTDVTTSGSGNTVTINAHTNSTFNYVQIDDTDSPYTVTADDHYISCDSTSGTITIELPDAPDAERLFIIKDRVGQAAVNNITVTTTGGAVTIDGSTSYVMNSNYTAIQLLFNGTSYEVY